MRKSFLTAAALAAVTATPGFTQTPPPIPPALQEPVSRDLANDPGWQRVEFARTFGGALVPLDAAQFRRLKAQRYLEKSEQRRAEALALAAAARAGASLPPASAHSIRDALKQDLRAWREAFEIDRKRWQAERGRWLADSRGATAAQWAERRAQWFAWRDRWIGQQRALLLAQRR